MDKKKIFYIAIAIIAIGILITCIFGFNVNLIYRKHQQVDIYIGKQFDNQEIKKIAQETLSSKDIIIEKVELYQDMVSIHAKEITSEQLEQLNQKINEKYEIENELESLEIVTVPKVRLQDKIKPYIVPVVISAILVIGYAIIRYRKLGIVEVILKVLVINIIPQGIYFSIFAITRLPFSRCTLPGALILAIITLFITFYQLETNKETQGTKK